MFLVLLCWLMCYSPPKTAKLGSEVAYPIPRESVSSHCADVAVHTLVGQTVDPWLLQRPGGLRRFFGGLAAAYEADVQNVFRQSSLVRRR